MDELPPPTTEDKEVEKTMDELEAQPRETEEWSWATIVLDVKVPRFKDRIPVEMDGNDTVLKLKEKILNHGGMLQAMPVERIVLQSHRTRVEMLDQQLLKDYAVLEYPDNEIDVFIKPPLPLPPPKQAVSTSSSSSSGGDGTSEKLKVMVLPMDTKEKIQIEVNGEDIVAVLREKLEELHQRLGFRLPNDGPYFFIHNQTPMDEKMSFQWHQVQQGDIVEIFNGFISAGDAVPSKRTKTLVSTSTPQSSVL
ncbi:hypothetical protein VNO77_12385 [Canavalia gladiata]|uniref:Ubiquitin-like domain-containing protein n=1 Tax=Canavalia gladiata TaxID=3824 RepID=A0AAN9QPQ2_CANGL